VVVAVAVAARTDRASSVGHEKRAHVGSACQLPAQAAARTVDPRAMRARVEYLGRMRLLAFTCVSSLLVAVGGCGGSDAPADAAVGIDASSRDAGAGDASSAGDSGHGDSGGGGADADVEDAGVVDAGATDSGTVSEDAGGADTGADAAAPRVCGGRAGPCGETEFCSFEPDAICGRADATGICQPRPTECPPGEPLCGCDGVLYASECAANLSGVSADPDGVCAAPTDSCDATTPCAAGGECVGDSCGLETWSCNYDRDCTDAPAVYCGCDGVAFSDSESCPSRPYAYRGDCGSPAPASCDTRTVACRRLPPMCRDGEAPSVIGTCYGPCVPISACTCATSDDCPTASTGCDPGGRCAI
jgi:hypothetical protein